MTLIALLTTVILLASCQQRQPIAIKQEVHEFANVNSCLETEVWCEVDGELSLLFVGRVYDGYSMNSNGPLETMWNTRVINDSVKCAQYEHAVRIGNAYLDKIKPASCIP